MFAKHPLHVCHFFIDTDTHTQSSLLRLVLCINVTALQVCSIKNAYPVFSELERLSNLVGRPSESHPLHNSGLLSLDPVQDKTPLYSQLLQAYKWSNKVSRVLQGVPRFTRGNNCGLHVEVVTLNMIHFYRNFNMVHCAEVCMGI